MWIDVPANSPSITASSATTDIAHKFNSASRLPAARRVVRRPLSRFITGIINSYRVYPSEKIARVTIPGQVLEQETGSDRRRTSWARAERVKRSWWADLVGQIQRELRVALWEIRHCPHQVAEVHVDVCNSCTLILNLTPWEFSRPYNHTLHGGLGIGPFTGPITQH